MDLPGFVWVLIHPLSIFLHIPFTALMKFLTRLRPRPLDRANSAYGLRQCALALAGRFLRPRRVPKNFIGPLRGYAGLV